MQRNLIFLGCSLAAAVPLAAQMSASAAETPLAARMQAFLREVEDTPNTELAAFFPRRGDWTWVQTLRDDGRGSTHTGIWRFPAVETARAIGAGGPVCDSFDEPRGEFGPFEGRFGMQAMFNRSGWRRLRGNRFVPPGADAHSPVFVEWRREDGQWVVSAFGDEDVILPDDFMEQRRGPFVPDRTGVAEDAAFAPADWYMITFYGMRLPQYGRPRAMDRASLVRIGQLHGVNVYVERGQEDGFLYLPSAPGQFQPYERWTPLPCD